jgi:hypothetical protein
MNTKKNRKQPPTKRKSSAADIPKKTRRDYEDVASDDDLVVG